jgi:hypothetical protein
MWFMFITLGFPVLSLLFLGAVALFGFPQFAVVPGLYINYAFFMPIHMIFGNSIVPYEEFGPFPGFKGYVAAILFYSAVSYFLAIVVAKVFVKRNAS